MRRPGILVAAALGIALVGCSTQAASTGAPVAASTMPHVNLVPASAVSTKLVAGIDGWQDRFPVITGFTRVRTADPCVNANSWDIETPEGRCPFLASGVATYSSLFIDFDGPGGKYCMIDPATGSYSHTPCYEAGERFTFEVDVYPIPAGAEPFAMRWAHSYYDCEGWQDNVKVGNARGAECDEGNHGEYANFLIVHHGKLFVVRCSEVSDLEQAFRDDFQLLA